MKQNFRERKVSKDSERSSLPTLFRSGVTSSRIYKPKQKLKHWIRMLAYNFHPKPITSKVEIEGISFETF